MAAVPLRPSAPRDRDRLIAAPARRAPTPGGIAWRRRMVWMVKIVLPIGATLLLASMALWPELAGDAERARVSFRRAATVAAEGGQMIDPRYHGVDAQGRPYVVTAATARQVGDDRTDMTAPKGDITMDSGAWLWGEARNGVYMQKLGVLDLSGDVTLYRDDGTVLQTESATMDMKAAAATGNQKVHAEGPFGTLDAQGFAATDRGDVLQFTGPGRLVLQPGGPAPKEPGK